MKAFQLRVELAPTNRTESTSSQMVVVFQVDGTGTTETRTKATNHGQIEYASKSNGANSRQCHQFGNPKAKVQSAEV